MAARLKLVGALSASVDILHPDRPKRIVIVASHPAVSEQTGGPIGFWWAELSHPFLGLTERGYEVDIASPAGGPLRADVWSDQRDDSGYSAEDLISLGFINSPAHMKLVEESKPLPQFASVTRTAPSSSAAKAPCTRSETTRTCTRSSLPSTRRST